MSLPMLALIALGGILFFYLLVKTNQPGTNITSHVFTPADDGIFGPCIGTAAPRQNTLIGGCTLTYSGDYVPFNPPVALPQEEEIEHISSSWAADFEPLGPADVPYEENEVKAYVSHLPYRILSGEQRPLQPWETVFEEGDPAYSAMGFVWNPHTVPVPVYETREDLAAAVIARRKNLDSTLAAE